MATIGPGHTLFTTGTLDSPQSLYVEAGGVFKAGNGATDNAVINMIGSTSQSVAGAYGEVVARATATIGVNADIVLRGGGTFTSTDGQGATLAIHGTLDNLGEIFATQTDLSGGAALIGVAAGGALLNSGTIHLEGATGSQYTPFDNISGTSLAIAGVLTNSGVVSVSGGLLGSGFGGAGARVLLDGGAASSLVNTGSIELHGAYGNGERGPTLFQDGGILVVASGTLLNQGNITVDPALNDQYGYGAAGGLLQSVGAGTILNAGTITVGGQTTGKSGPTPAGTLSIAGQYFDNTGSINVIGGMVPNGAGGVLNVTTSLNLSGEVYLYAGYSGGSGATAVFSGTVGIGVNAPGTLIVGGSFYEASLGPAVLTITGNTTLCSHGTIAVNGPPTYGDGGPAGSATISASGTLTDLGGSIVGYGTLTNDGLLKSVGAYSVVYPGQFNNNGGVVVDGGHLLVETDPYVGYVGGNGDFTITSGGTLSFYSTGGVGAGQTVRFAATPGVTETLALNVPGYFDGVLAGLNDSSVIDVVGQNVIGVTTNGDLLNIIEPGMTYHLTLSAPLAAGTSFTLKSDGHGGTDVGVILPTGVIAAPPASELGFSRDPSSQFGGHLTP